MKLYHFNPNNYGSEYFVMAETEQMAVAYLMQMLNEKSSYGMPYFQTYRNDLLRWENAIRINTLPKKYSIDCYEVGQVIESEIS